MTKQNNTEVPGSVLATAAMTQRILTKAGHAVHAASYRMETLEDEGVSVLRIAFKARGGPSGEWLAVIGAATHEGAKVAFHSADSFHGCVEGVCNRLMNGSLKWKDDEYA